MLKPIKSEKSMREANNGKYTFSVPVSMTKTEIKDLVQKAYPVQVIAMNTTITPGKSYRTGKRGSAQRPSVKKVIVTLKKDQKLDIYA